MAENLEALEAGKLFRIWTSGRTETKSCKRAFFAWSPLLDNAKWDERRCMKNSRFCQFERDRSFAEACVRCCANEKGHSERDVGA